MSCLKKRFEEIGIFPNPVFLYKETSFFGHLLAKITKIIVDRKIKSASGFAFAVIYGEVYLRIGFFLIPLFFCWQGGGPLIVKRSG